jgi:hypothetical protein
MYLRDGEVWKVSNDPFDQSLYRQLEGGTDNASSHP